MNSFRKVNFAVRACLLTLAGLLFVDVDSASCQTRYDCWQIDYSTTFAGHIKVTFCDKAILMRLEKFGVIVIATGPKWNSLVYNQLNKRYMEVSNEQWRSSKFIEKLLKRQLEKASTMRTEFTHNTKTIEGFPTSELILKTKDASGAMAEASQIWVTPNLHVPAEFKQFLQIALGVSENIDGTPLQISVMQKDLVDKSPHLVQALVAYKIVKTTTTDAFRELPGYQEVKTEFKLLTEDDTK